MIDTRTHYHNNKNKTPRVREREQKYKNINHNKIKQMEFLQKLTNEFPDVYPPIPPISPHFSNTNKNAGIMFWYAPSPHTREEPAPIHNHQQIQILTGIETCYLTDKVVPEIKAILQKYQYYESIAPAPQRHANTPYHKTKEQEEQEVYQEFSKRAKVLTRELKQPIYFDKPIAHSTQPHIWQIQYRVTGDKPKFGILKGSMEEEETPLEAIQREIQEELFPLNEYIPLDPNKITPLPEPIKLNQDSLYAFHYQVTEREKQLIETTIQRLQQENYGELVQYQFRPMTEIFTSPQSTQPNFHLLKQHFNGKSRLYIHEFYSTLG